MKKLIACTAILAACGLAGTAHAEPLLQVDDPTPDQTFSGTYTCYTTDPETGEQVETTCAQTGYVAVYEDGAEACNGNEEVTRPDDGTPLQGYVWVGPGHAASNPTAAAPGDVAGAGNDHETADGTPTGDSPCTEGPESGDAPAGG